MKSLDAFMEELRADVDDFEKEWRKGHKKNPKNFPMELDDDNSGEWWEQFMAHLSMRGKVSQ